MRSNLGHAAALAFFLIAAGLSIFFVKVLRYDYPITPGAVTTLWDFEIYLEFTGRNEPARLDVFIPNARAERDVTGEQFYNGSFGLNLATSPANGNRSAVWSYRYPESRKVLRYSAQSKGESSSTPLPDAFREQSALETPFESDTVKRQAFIVWVGSLRRRSADEATFAELMLSEIFGGRAVSGEDTDEIQVLLKEYPLAVARLELARETLASRGVPARIANGVFLTDDKRRAEIEHWLEYHVDGRDLRYFPSGAPNRFFDDLAWDRTVLNVVGRQRTRYAIGAAITTRVSRCVGGTHR